MNSRTLLVSLVIALSSLAANAQDTKPASQSSKKAKPAPAKPATTKPDDAKPADAKPADAKPADGTAPDAAKPAQPPAQRETPPDQKAYTDILKITEPEKKIEALEKFKKDFPTSSMLTGASLSILSTLTQKLPKQEGRIRATAQALYDSAEIKDKGRISGQMADTLLNAGLLLEDAQKYAEISLLSLDQTQYMKDQKAMAERRKQPAPTDEELAKRFDSTRAPRLTALGRIEVELGHTAQGRSLLEQAYAITPDSVVTAAALGDLAMKSGEPQKALDYLVTARLGGRASASTLESLNAAYKKTHDGKLDGLDALLDAEYHKKFPNPLHLDAYTESEKRSDRVVLGEVFTGSGCPPCVGADLAFDASMERYNRKDLVVVMYHQHIPQPDPMTNPDTQARRKYYDVNGVPSYAIDGKMVNYNGAGREGTKDVYSHIKDPIEKELETSAEAHLDVHANVAGNSVNVKAAVDDVKSDSKDLKVHVLLLEKEIRYSGENGIRFHPMVVRAMGGEGDDGFALADGKSSFEQSWDLDKISAGLKDHLDTYEAGGHRGNPFTFIEKKYQIDRGNLAVVVFVQDVKTKHILQTAFVDLGTSTPSHVTADGSKGEK